MFNSPVEVGRRYEMEKEMGVKSPGIVDWKPSSFSMLGYDQVVGMF